MTSKLTRLTDEELAELAFYAGESTSHSDPNYLLSFESLATGSSVLSIVIELQERRKAAMDSEPVLWAWHHLDMWHVTSHDGRARDLWLSGFKVIPLYRHAQPVLVIPDEMTAEQAYEIGYYYGDPVDVFARGANWMRQHIIDSTLAAAPQSPGSDPATVPGKWIPVSERMPENDGAYLCWDNRYVTTYAFIFGAWQANQFVAKNITHWMPLPAAPQEVK
ncbi:hypothetical protein KPC81_05214 [Klebsiella pneumoniae]|nr:hypothetical protein [Klebsiella pneumoniae]MCB8873017.1 hypothetical protein [Klebsiella pneumoniae]